MPGEVDLNNLSPEQREALMKRILSGVDSEADDQNLADQRSLAKMLGSTALDFNPQGNAFSAIAQGLSGYAMGKQHLANKEQATAVGDRKRAGREEWMRLMFPDLYRKKKPDDPDYNNEWTYSTTP